MLELLDRRGAEREAGADRRQQRHVGELPPARPAVPGGGQDVPGAGPGAEGVQHHRPRIPGRHLAPGDPRPGHQQARGLGRDQPGAGSCTWLRLRRGLRLRLPLRLCRGLVPLWLRAMALPQWLLIGAAGLAGGQFLLTGAGQVPADGGLGHAQPGGDLRLAGPGGPPLRGPRPRPRGKLGLGPGRADQPGGALAAGPLVQRGHVAGRQSHLLRDLLAGEPQLAGDGHGDVAHRDVAVGVARDDHLPGDHEGLAVVVANAQVGGVRHAVQHRRTRRAGHATDPIMNMTRSG